MESLIKDLRYTIRMLAKQPGFTAVVVFTFALGIGANASIFSVVNTVLLHPLPYPQPDQVVALWETRSSDGQSRSRVAPANFFDWRKRTRVFQDMAAYGPAELNLTGAGEPEQLLGGRVSAGYFEVLGVHPIVGRSFLPDEHEPGKGRVVILGHDLWALRFGSDDSIPARPITLDGQSYTVVGVMPAGIYPTWPTVSGQVSFREGNAQFWIPMPFDAEWAANRRTHVLGVIGRLTSGVSVERARAELDTIASQLQQENIDDRGEGIAIDPLMDELVGPIRPALLILLGAVGLVILIACSNITGLLLAQLAGREREIAIRTALGATRGRLIRQFLVECCLLQLVGGGIGIWLAWIAVAAIPKFVPQRIPRLEAVKVDSGVLALTLLLSLATAVTFSLIMVWQWSCRERQGNWMEGGRTVAGWTGRQSLRRVLVVAQVSLAIMLMVGAGLLIKSFWLLRLVDPGFNPNRVLTINLSLPGSQYHDWRRISDFYSRLLEHLQELPGVQTAAAAYDHPLQSSWIDSFTIEGRPAPEPGEMLSADFHPVSPGYFSTAGIELIQGRDFTNQDDPGHPGAVIVNAAFAERYFPSEESLGKRLRILSPSRFWPGEMPMSFEVVGLVRDVKSSGLNRPAEPAFYVPARQMPTPEMSLLVRTAGDPLGLVGAVRNAVWQIDPNQPVSGVSTMEHIVSDSIAQPRLGMALMGLFGLIAMTLASIGIYGLLSYTVRQRAPEIGIRMALGSRQADILKLVVSDGLGLALAGIGIGLAASFGLTRFLSSVLFGVAPTDPTTFILVAVILTLVALSASYLPARRAAQADPMIALRDH